MTVFSHPPDMKEVLDCPYHSGTVNMFDLNATEKGVPHCYTGKTDHASIFRKAARATLAVVLTMIVMTAVSLLLLATVNLKWRFCHPPDEDAMQRAYICHGFHQPLTYEDYWKTLSLEEKRQVMFQATYGEVDLYDMYGVMAKEHGKIKPHEDAVQ